MSKKTDYKLKNEAFLVDKKHKRACTNCPRACFTKYKRAAIPKGAAPTYAAWCVCIIPVG